MPSGGKRIVILGGGMGSLAAAYYLTEQPNWQHNYDVTVYQLGWRLGGKCASSRNSQLDGRIEEHGLHVWFGFYQNAFALLRKCYAELGRPSPLDPTQGAFVARDTISMLEQDGTQWAGWGLPFPPHQGEPGDPGNPEHDSHSVVRALVQFLVDYVKGWLTRGLSMSVDFGTDVELALRNMALLETAAVGDDTVRDSTLEFLRTWRAGVASLPDLSWSSFFRGWRRMKLVADLGFTTAIGILEDRLLDRGIHVADNEEFIAWLRRHGAHPDTVNIERDTPLRALYDTCFAFECGDVHRPNFAAGTALGVLLRIGLTYWGHVVYLMRAGMGDVVIAPLYEVLQQRGVKFEFFHRITKLEVDPQQPLITAIRYVRQAKVTAGPYDPLVRHGAEAWWPEHPHYEQLQNGEALRGIDLESHWYDRSHDYPEEVLHLGSNDEVVLGISLGGLSDLCTPLAQRDPAWQRMLDGLPSIQTQSMQLWFDRTAAELGWAQPQPAAMVAAPEPHDVWADMSHVLTTESWPANDAPKSVHYLCGPLAGDYLVANPPDAPQRARDEVRAVAIDWLTKYARSILPGAALPGSTELDWRLLHAPSATSGHARIDAQWLHANIDPTERYVLSPAVANALRLPSDQPGFTNLVLAGDWTRTAINAGCVEAAVMSGMAASRKLCAWPTRIHGESFMNAGGGGPSPNAGVAPPITAPAPNVPVKVAILGGGCGALSVAYWLSANPQLRQQFHVTVYTQGWRLGGKGASGRRPPEQRIEEHGLHMMMGFYETVFHVMRDCYQNMPHGPSDAFTSWDQAFVAQRLITLWIKGQPRNYHFPHFPGEPGESTLALQPSTTYMQEGINTLVGWLVEKVLPGIQQQVSQTYMAADFVVQDGLEAFSEELESRLDATTSVPALLDTLVRMQNWFKMFVAPWLKPLAYELYLYMDLGLAGAIGFLTDVVPYGEDGYERINDRDFKDWLVQYRADAECAQSALIMSVYDLAFAYRDGNSSSPQNGAAAAGALLRLFVRMALTYKDAPLWKMNGGMGDIIFTPLYELLAARNVRFEFFHRVRDLHLQGDDIRSVDFDLQAELVDPTKPYDPFVTVAFQNAKEWKCWPAEPKWALLKNAPQNPVDLEDPWTQHKAGSRTLVRGQDFDAVVLAIPPAASQWITGELSARYSEWQTMLARSSSVATRSSQQWFRPDFATLNSPHGVTVATTYVDPQRSWAEMSHLVPYELGPSRSCEYLCGTLCALPQAPAYGIDMPAYKVAARTTVINQVEAWLDQHAGGLWPGVMQQNGDLNRGLRDHNYASANVGYSDLYVQTPPGSVTYRLAPGWHGPKNLFLAGDWTRTSINGGCAEAAFESGLHAACALAGIGTPPTPG